MMAGINKSLVIVAMVLLSACVSQKKYDATRAEANDLRDKNVMLQQQVQTTQSEVDELNKQNASMQTDLQSCATTEQKLTEVQSMIAEEEQVLQRVQEKLEVAMEDFSDRGVDVYYKDGFLYVSLPDDLLYKSGSASLGKDGKEALGTLATVLNDYPRLKVVVVGNTDNVDYKRKGDNWSLSTERANGVVRLLSEQYKVDPVRLTAAGKGKFNPVADNNTADGRAKNRRTDIIVNPDYERIVEMARKE